MQIRIMGMYDWISQGMLLCYTKREQIIKDIDIDYNITNISIALA